MAQRLQKKIMVFLLALCLIATGIKLYPDDMCTVLASEIDTESTKENMVDQTSEAESEDDYASIKEGQVESTVENVADQTSEAESGDDSASIEESSVESTRESMADQTNETESSNTGKSDADAGEKEKQEIISERTEYIKDSECTQSGNTVSGNDVVVPADEAEELMRKPKILLKGCNLSGAELGAGSQNWLEAVFKNSNESETIYNLKVTVSTGSSSMQVIPNSFYFSTIEPGKEIRLEGELKTDVNAESGTFPLYFEFEYEDEKGNAINGKESISLTVTGQPAVHQPRLLVESCNLSGKDLGEGSQEQMIVTFKNYSDSQAVYNLKVTASAGSSMQLVPGSFYFSKVGPGEVISIEGSLKVAAKAESGMMPLGFELEYEDEKGTAIIGKEGVVLSIAEHPVTRQPQILLENCNLSGKELEAGSQEQMTVTFKNCSKSQAMHNVKVTVSAGASYMQVLPASFYFEKVGAGEQMELQSEVTITSDAESGVVPLTFDFQYEDWEGVVATGQETAYLTVAHPIKMELDAANIPSFVYASETQEFSVRALNLSRTGVYNVRISLSGTGLFPKEDVFIGNMEAGTEGAGTMHIYIGTRTMTEIGTDTGNSDEEKYGQINGTVTLSYEDAKGETYEITQNFQTEIKKAQILSLEVNEKVETNLWQIPVFVIIIAGLAILAVSLWLRLRKKNVLLEEARKIQDES